MSEHTPHHGSEHFKATPEKGGEHAEHKAHHEGHKGAEHHKHAEKDDFLAQVEQSLLSREAKQEAVSAEEVTVESKQAEASPLAVTKELKKQKQAHTMSRVRRQLTKPSRAFSKVIHQPVVAAVSEVGAKTVARPSGVLTGGLCALIGSSLLLYMAKHYGFQYNFLAFALLFVSGFGLGLVLEAIIRLFRGKSRV